MNSDNAIDLVANRTSAWRELPWRGAFPADKTQFGGR